MTELEIKREANAATRMYLFEHFKEIDNERTKSSYLLAFEGLIFTQLLIWMQDAPLWCKTGFIILAVLALIASIAQLFFPTTAALYGDYSGVYAAKVEADYLLNTEFQSLQQQKAEAMRLAARSRHANQIAFLLLAASLSFPIMYFFLPVA